MVFKEILADIYISPTGRRISILLLLVAVLIISLMWGFSEPVRYDSPKIMVCEKCGYRQQLGTAGKLKCTKCDKEMGCLWKCMTCSYEFEYMPPKTKGSYGTEEAFRLAKIEAGRCPNCNSVETFPVTTRNMPEKTPAPSK
ncbi:MAG: hypothetical protein WC637_08770 [Victivallales bacterium]